MDDVTWAVLTVSLTVLGGIYTWFAYQRRGLAAGLKGAGITMLPLAAYLTKTLQMFSEIVDAVADWAVSLVFSPAVWLGVVLAGLGVVLFGAGRLLDGRGKGEKKGEKKPRRTKSGDAGELPPGAKPRSEPVVDDDLADIEAILKKRGIT
jgi:hypothetical protein